MEYTRIPDPEGVQEVWDASGRRWVNHRPGLLPERERRWFSSVDAAKGLTFMALVEHFGPITDQTPLTVGCEFGVDRLKDLPLGSIFANGIQGPFVLIDTEVRNPYLAWSLGDFSQVWKSSLEEKMYLLRLGWSHA